jgi:hypothetical protein
VSVGFDASAEYHHVEQLKRKLVQLAARVEALQEAEEKMASEREAAEMVAEKMASERERVEVEMATVESELDAAVAAPASGVDPTLGLPDELLIMVLLLVPFEALWTGRCAGVCRRWWAVAESEPVKRRTRKGKWEAYAKGWIEPRRLEGHTDDISCLAIGLDGTIYSGSGNVVRVWSGGNEIRRLGGRHRHTAWVVGVTVGPDGTVYAGSFDGTVQVWSGEDGTHTRALSGHRCNRASVVHALVVGVNDKLYTGSDDSTIHVWSTRDGAHIQTLKGHAASVVALLSRLDGRIYSASVDSTIRVWSGDDGAHLQTLQGHTDEITSMVWGPDGRLYSGSLDCTIRVWSDDGGTTIFKTTNYEIVYSLAWTDGNLLATLSDSTTGEIWVWSSDQVIPSDPPSHVLDRAVYGNVVGGPSGNVYVVSGNAILKL